MPSNFDDFIATFNDVTPGFVDIINEQSAPSESWVQTATRALTGLIMTDAQRRLLNVQLDRAARGLPPLNASQYGLGVNVGLSPETLRVVGFAGLAIAALLIFRRRG